jgi:hypothetical protein
MTLTFFEHQEGCGSVSESGFNDFVDPDPGFEKEEHKEKMYL